MKVNAVEGKIGVAVSGGADSMVLLDLYRKVGQNLCVVNIEHGIRGESSIRDSAFVSDFCSDNGIQLYFRSVDAVDFAKKQGMSIELAARTLRRAVFRQLIEDGLVAKIALAHHADDNAETILMRIFRGTGLRGLCGMQENESYIRPLLHVTRTEIEEYALQNGIPFITDETNAQSDYNRNFIRNEILPLVRNRYPECVRAINRLSENAIDACAVMDRSVKPCKTNGDERIIEDFFYLPDAEKKISFVAAMEQFGVVQDVESTHRNAVVHLQTSPNNASVDLPLGYRAVKTDSDLLLYRELTEKFLPVEFLPTLALSYRGWHYTFELRTHLSASDKSSSFMRFFPEERGHVADMDKLKGTVVRERETGDVFRKVNGREKLLSDFLNERKLTKREKDDVLVLAKGKQVFAILGLEIAEEAKIDQNTFKTIYIRKEKRTND